MAKKQNLTGVYVIVNVVSQDFYIGSAWGIGGVKERLIGHFKHLRKGISSKLL